MAFWVNFVLFSFLFYVGEMMQFLDKVFHLEDAHTNVKRELVAALTTFVSLSYILFVNPNILSAAGINKGAAFTVTAIATAIGCFLMGFITNYPIELSPLARRSETQSDIAERFELFIGGKEIANGFNELNDPLDQKERFEEQVRQKDAGDEEAQYMDEDFVWALGYGMPPTAGEGIGIDRLVMLLTNQRSIKDVILFPALKPSKVNYDILLEDTKDS